MTWDRERTLQWMRRMESRPGTAALYDVLEVHAGATADELRLAFFRIAEGVHPDRHRGTLDAITLARLERCMGRLSAAYATLRNPERRERHDQERAVRATGRVTTAVRAGTTTGASPGLATTPTARAQSYMRKAEAARRVEDRGAALFNARLAVASDPSNPDAQALLKLIEAWSQGA